MGNPNSVLYKMNRVFLLVVFCAFTTAALVLPQPRRTLVAGGTFRLMEEEAFNATDFTGFQVDDDTEAGSFSARENLPEYGEEEYGDEEYEYDEPVFYEDYGSYEDIYDSDV